jgi:outer membrane protein OmpA-like peptidoglycan-associated protein
MSRKFLSILIGGLGIFLLTACVNTPSVSKATKVKQKKEEPNAPLSNRGKYLYSMLIDIKTGKFVKELFPNKSYNKNKFEEIRVYEGGVYPSYEPSQIGKNSSSIFRDSTFDSIKTTGAVIVGMFDEKKFLEISNNAIKRRKEIKDEEYNKVKFAIYFKIDTSINNEYANATVLIHHKPSLKLKRAIFYINGSAMYADRLSSVEVSPILRKEIYKVGLPTGKNSVKVSFSSFDGQRVAKSAMVENLFKGNPSFYIVAIGVNEFPNWTIGTSLKNAVNDANLIKDTFTKRSTKLFNGRVKIKPYTLDVKDTTKDNITKLIEEVRKSVKPNDYFLLYVASHGITKGEGEDKEYYFAPSDFTIKQTYQNGFKENQISEYLINIPSIFRIAILDTCYAGREVESIKKELISLPFAKREGISVLTAAKSTQEANDNYNGHGLFTYILVEGLSGKADYNRDGVVDSIEIAQYVKNNVGRVSQSETDMRQDAVVLPEPTQSYNRRFELTLLEKKKFKKFRPNVFTPRESQLYINAIRQQDAGMMNGIIRNNSRHNSNEKTESVEVSQLSKEALIQKLVALGSIDININFAVNSDKLSDKEIQKLATIASALTDIKLKDKRVFIEGHTDSDGDEFSNMALSQRRADSVANLLADKFGIKKEKLTSLGFGEIYPVVDNSTEVEKKKNRRVSIFIYE